MYMYAINLHLLPRIMILGIVISAVIAYCLPPKVRRIVGMCVCVLALCIILKYTVIGRKTNGLHRFVFVNTYSNEFYREMILNLFLFFPLGIGLPYAVRNCRRAVALAFLLSSGIELWQYMAGTGVAQGTDVIMNTLGTFIGTFSYGLFLLFEKRRKRKKQCELNL